MFSDVDKILNAMAYDLEDIAKAVMDSNVGVNEKTGTNTLSHSELYKNLETSVEWQSGNPMVRLLFNYYIEYIEWDRPKDYGRMPPIAPLIVWLKRKNIPSGNQNVRALAFAIARAIQRDGHKGRPVREKMNPLAEEKWEEWSERLFEAVTASLAEWFAKK